MRLAKGVILGLLLLSFLIACSPYASASLAVPANLNSGPLINSILYRVIASQDQRILAMQAGEIEMDTSYFDPVHYESLHNDPDVGIFDAFRNGYGHITINCRDPPLNETVLRRAFAFAYDKTRVKEDVLDGLSREHDSVVPYRNSWCIEEELPWHYYANQSTYGNLLLNASGLFPYGPDGWRTYKDQSIEPIRIEYFGASILAGGVARVTADTLESLHIHAMSVSSDYNECMARLDHHMEYDMVFFAYNFYSNDVDWLAFQYWSEYADTPYRNPTNFMNATYDACREQLLFGTTYEEVHNASAWMQRILHEQVPLLVVYMNIYRQAYRTDRFIGHVPDLGGHIAGPWTMRKIHQLDGTDGGVVPIAISENPDSFNMFTAESSVSEIILSELWPSLYRHGPDMKPYPDLATNLLIESHADNPTVPDGHTRFTIDIIQNATWSDSIPLTAADVAFTFAYLVESGLASQGWLSPEFSGAWAQTNTRVVVEYTTESYWHFSDFAFKYVIPEHIFNDVDGIGYDGWSDWNPVLNEAHPFVTCGPFLLEGYEPNRWCNLTWNPLFHYRVDASMHEPQPPTNSTVTTTTTTATNGWPDVTFIMTSAISTGSAAVILFSVYGIYRHRRLASPPAG